MACNYMYSNKEIILSARRAILVFRVSYLVLPYGVKFCAKEYSLDRSGYS